MKIINQLSELQNFRDATKHDDKKIALIPTMGALHEGHIELVREALKHADIALPYIFVNPTQFAPHEDFDQYPRDIDADIQKLESVGAHALWLPSEEDIYPDGKVADIHVDHISDPLEGEHRPHFFDGVATVVSRMLNLSKPDIAIFGEKDFQQLQVIKKMVADHNIPAEIIGVPTVRDDNGLALSSRNAYLSGDEYTIAIQLNKILEEMASGALDEKKAQEKLLGAGFDKVDYCAARNAKTFLPKNPDRVLAAVWLGQTRLIDNMPMA